MRRRWLHTLVEIAIDALVIGTVIVVAILTERVWERLALFAAAWLLLTGKFLVMRGRR